LYNPGYSAFFFVCFRVVEYRSRADMERAIKQMSQSNLDGRKIFVKEVCVIYSVYTLIGHRTPCSPTTHKKRESHAQPQFLKQLLGWIPTGRAP
jgi:hypothetical protein